MRNDFKKLLESVKAQCPELITEEIVNDMMQTFDDGIAKIEADATAEGQALGFKDGYNEGKRVAQEQAQMELAALTEKMDEEAVQKLTSVLEMLDENHTAKLQELYDFMTAKLAEAEAATEKALADQDEEYAAKFETAINAINDDHAAKFETAVNAINDDHAAKFETAVNAINDDHAAKFETAVNAINDDHAAKFETAVNAINDDHAAKLQLYKEAVEKKYDTLLNESIEAIDNENTAKLKEVVKLLKEDKEKAVKTVKAKVISEAKTKLAETKTIYESKIADLNKELANEKERKLSILAEGVEKYLNYALEQYKPKTQIISEQKYNAALNTLEKVTDLLKVNTIIQESKDGIFADYEEKLAKAKAEQNRLINESIELKSKLNKQEAALLLESKLLKCTPGEARFLRGYFKGATSPKIIEESLEAARTAYKKILAEQRQSLQESVRQNINPTPSTVIIEEKKEPVKKQEKQVIAEEKQVEVKQTKPEVKTASQESLVDIYASYLQPKK